MNQLQMYTELLFAKAAAQGVPLFGTFELTSRCNLDCKMCYIHRRENDAAALRDERSASWWISLAEQAQKLGTLQLLLTGGEPLLRRDFREIYTACKKLGMLMFLNTNAVLLDDDMLEFFKKDPPMRVNITLYGASRETYAALCGNGDAYDRVIRAICGLKAANIPVKLNFTITPQNRHDADAVYAFARENDLLLQAASYSFPPVRAGELGACEGCRMSAEEAACAQLAYDRSRFTAEQLRVRWEKQLAGLATDDPDRACQELPAFDKIRCRAGSTTFWVTWDGQLRPCGMMTEPGLPVGRFAEDWQALRGLRAEIPMPPACAGCDMRVSCDVCPALAFAETGSFSGKPEYLCRKTRAELALARRGLEEIKKTEEDHESK